MTNRSHTYPTIGLSMAVELTRSLWEAVGTMPVNATVAAAAAGYVRLNGRSSAALAAMKKFGLLIDDGSGMKVSNLAVDILNAYGWEDQVTSLRRAAIQPELFRELFKTHLQASPAALRSYLIAELGFSETAAKTLAEAVRDTIFIARLHDPQYVFPNSSSGTAEIDEEINFDELDDAISQYLGVAKKSLRTVE